MIISYGFLTYFYLIVLNSALTTNYCVELFLYDHVIIYRLVVSFVIDLNVVPSDLGMVEKEKKNI